MADDRTSSGGGSASVVDARGDSVARDPMASFDAERAPPADGGSPGAASTDEVPRAGPPDPAPTVPLDLRKITPRQNKHRRRHAVAELSFRRSGQRAVQVPLDQQTTVIGRDDGCDIILGEASVSRRHAKIFKNEQGYFEMIDLDSTNGVLVQGVPLPRLLLCDGDRFTIGDTEFLFSARLEPPA